MVKLKTVLQEIKFSNERLKLTEAATLYYDKSDKLNRRKLGMRTLSD